MEGRHVGLDFYDLLIEAIAHNPNDPHTPKPWLPSRTPSHSYMRKVIFDSVDGRITAFPRNNVRSNIALTTTAVKSSRTPAIIARDSPTEILSQAFQLSAVGNQLHPTHHSHP
jgi:hypothetical protein